MQFHILTIFPQIFDSWLKESLIKRALKKGLFKINVFDLRKFTFDRHHTVDDRPYGGGPGMIFKIEPIWRAMNFIKNKSIRSRERKKVRTILLTPAGRQFIQKDAVRLSKYEHLIFLCGRYEGIDSRADKLVDEKLSLGPFVLSGGETAAMVMVECIARLIPGVVGKKESLIEESFAALGKKRGAIVAEYPQYTRPAVFSPRPKVLWRVPKILLSGNQQKIKEWRRKKMAIDKR